MWRPRREKYRKNHEWKKKETWVDESRKNGEIWLVGLSIGELKEKQLEGIILGIKRELKKEKYKIRVGVYPHRGKTSKGLQSKMGKGKGEVDYYYGRIIRGKRIIGLKMEEGIRRKGRRALEIAKSKIGVRTRIEEGWS